MMRAIRPSTLGVVALAFAALVPLVSAQEAKSPAAVRELVALLDARLDGTEMTYLAAADPGDPGRFVGALYMKTAGTLFVISGKFKEGTVEGRLARREYQDAYVDLNSASTPESRLFFTDVKCDGLVLDPKGDAGADTLEGPWTRRIAFDGEHKKQKLSEQDYRSAFVDADGKYEAAVRALIAEASKKS